MNTSLHLTAEQIDDALIGDLAAGPVAHLADCSTCQTRVAELTAPIASFRELSLAWAERRSATMPNPSRAQTGRRSLWVNVGAGAAATALAAAIAAAIAVPMLFHHHAAPIATNTAAATPSSESSSEPSPEEIAQDNQLLAAIDNTLNTPIGRPASSARQTRSNANLLHDRPPSQYP